MSKATRFALIMIIAHAAVVALHGTAHRILEVELSRAQTLFIAAVIIIAPLLAGILLLNRASRAGAVILTLSMAGAFVFGLYNHFLVISTDHVFHVPGDPRSLWVIMFQVTAALLALVEVMGAVAGMMVLKRDFASVKS